jgi:hypothetical protein
MKKQLFFIVTILSLTALHAASYNSWQPTNLADTHVPTTPAPTTHVAGRGHDAALKKAVTKLDTILQTDDVASLKKFIATNGLSTTYPFTGNLWASVYYDLPFIQELATPLIAAVWYGAVNCVITLLENPKTMPYVVPSINNTSSHGHSALRYAQHPPSSREFPSQHTGNYRVIAQILAQPKYKAISV